MSRESRSDIPTPGLLPASWRVHLPVFDGPLDLLLQLIKVNKVEIADIPVATICDQFHEYLALMEILNLDIAAEYIYEAALLIHLKSRLLLPRPKTLDGAVIEEDPRQDLVARLLEYRRLKDAAQSLAEVDRMRAGVWPRRVQKIDLGPDPEPEEATIDLGEVSLFDLLGAFKKAMERYDKEHPPALQLSGETFTVRSQFDRLLRVLSAARPYDLLQDLRHLSCRSEAIACFLAVLELARLNLVRIHQTGDGELLLYRTTREVGHQEVETFLG